ncbi:hypothetical protein BDA99DRAFT_530944 [Phascolomyces articulosus]|uniref:Uncharacterized protein n=1 Tax=Phascolomyces articulosus TaxID=60185 RepID=A0AAD5JJH9_9FUNG|nr:hypothetical protein BDA99DRAFT_530944 [Phascolomyces articulosus]
MLCVFKFVERVTAEDTYGNCQPSVSNCSPLIFRRQFNKSAFVSYKLVFCYIGMNTIYSQVSFFQVIIQLLFIQILCWIVSYRVSRILHILSHFCMKKPFDVWIAEWNHFWWAWNC